MEWIIARTINWSPVPSSNEHGLRGSNEWIGPGTTRLETELEISQVSNVPLSNKLNLLELPRGP